MAILAAGLPFLAPALGAALLTVFLTTFLAATFFLAGAFLALVADLALVAFLALIGMAHILPLCGPVCKIADIGKSEKVLTAVADVETATPHTDRNGDDRAFTTVEISVDDGGAGRADVPDRAPA